MALTKFEVVFYQGTHPFRQWIGHRWADAGEERFCEAR